MRYLKLLYLLVGLALLDKSFVLSEIDIGELVARVGQVGWGFF